MIKRSLGLALLLSGLCVPAAIAVEYQGKVIDGQKFDATAYSHESGGTFNVKVQFKNKQATLYFVNGGKQTIRLDSREIEDPQEIVGWGRPFGVRLGEFFNVGLSDNRDLHNLEPTGTRAFEGLWTLSLDQDALEATDQDISEPTEK